VLFLRLPCFLAANPPRTLGQMCVRALASESAGNHPEPPRRSSVVSTESFFCLLPRSPRSRPLRTVSLSPPSSSTHPCSVLKSITPPPSSLFCSSCRPPPLIGRLPTRQRFSLGEPFSPDVFAVADYCVPFSAPYFFYSNSGNPY